MDSDVIDLLVRLLSETEFGGRGAELAKVAELHARAMTQVEALRTGGDVAGEGGD